MSLVDSGSLARTSDRINHAHFLGEKITQEDAKAASRWICSRYGQDIPDRIRNSAKPNPRWASIPKSFNLTDAERPQRPRTFTGETLENAALRMVHSREAARALFILGGVLGETAPEALALSESVRDRASRLKEQNAHLFCCGPCTVSVWRLAAIGGPALDEDALDLLLSALPKYQDNTGTWRRFPFFYTLAALSEIEHPKAIAALEYALPECERRRAVLRPRNEIDTRRMAVVDRVLEAMS